MRPPTGVSASLLVMALGLAGCAGAPPPTRSGDAAWDSELGRLGEQLAAVPDAFDRTTYLRRYAGALIDIGRPDDETRRLFAAVDFGSFDAAAFYPLFRDDRVPVACGITTFFYIRLLQAFGFRAYQYSFGFTDPPYQRFVHSVVLVDVPIDGASRLVVQDPYLNLTYRGPDGQPLDFLEMLATLRAGGAGRVVMDPGSVGTSLLVPDPGVYGASLSDGCRAQMTAALRRPDGTLATRLPIARTYDTLMRSPCGRFEADFVEAMRQHGHDGPFVTAYLLRAADLVGEPDWPDLQRRIDAIRR